MRYEIRNLQNEVEAVAFDDVELWKILESLVSRMEEPWVVIQAGSTNGVELRMSDHAILNPATKNRKLFWKIRKSTLRQAEAKYLKLYKKWLLIKSETERILLEYRMDGTQNFFRNAEWHYFASKHLRKLDQ